MATDLNSVILIGRLTRDAEIKYSTAGTAIGRMSIANTQSKKDGDQWTEEGHFFDCVLIGKRADALQRYLVKGQQIAIRGTLQQNRWQDKDTGQNRSKVEIFVLDIQLVGGKKSDGQSQSSDPVDTVKQVFEGSEAGFPDNGFDDDIPL